jgi:hypothetical protein
MRVKKARKRYERPHRIPKTLTKIKPTDPLRLTEREVRKKRNFFPLTVF